jgi:signal transduction histidine kinase
MGPRDPGDLRRLPVRAYLDHPLLEDARGILDPGAPDRGPHHSTAPSLPTPWAPGPISRLPCASISGSSMAERTSRGSAAKVRRYLDRLRSRLTGRADARELAARLESQREELKAALEQANRERTRYHELFHDAPAAYLTTDVGGRIRDINLAAARLLHVPPAHAVGKPLSVYVRDPDGIRPILARLARKEVTTDWETAVLPGDAPPIPVQLSPTPVAGPGGTAGEIRWLLRDVRNERVADEREWELQQEQAARTTMARVAERARHLADASGRLMGVLEPNEVWSTAASILEAHATAIALVEIAGERLDPDTELRVRGVGGTQAARRRLEPLLHRSLDLRHTHDALGIPDDLLSAAIRRGKPEVIPGRASPVSRPDEEGDAAAQSGLIVPLKGRHTMLGAIVIWLRPEANVGEEMLVNRHLADRVALALETAQLFQEVVRARRRAEEAGAAEADFLSMISHELRTPLTAIVSYATLLEEHAEALPDNLRRYARQIAAAAHHQRELVEQILSYKGLQRERAGDETEELDFRDVASFAVGLVRPQVEGRPIELETHLPDAPVRGTCDAGKLRQILTNLLANAVRHTDCGYIQLSVDAGRDWVEFRVRDTGEGIPAEDLPRIYDRFWRGPSARQHTGSGLGLTIVRELVARMHGDIEVESELDAGTTFTIRLPRVAPTGRHGGGP